MWPFFKSVSYSLRMRCFTVVFRNGRRVYTDDPIKAVLVKGAFCPTLTLR